MQLFDTNILIYYLKGNEEIVPFVEEQNNAGISVITKIELLGRKNLTPAEIKNLSEFIDTFFIINLDNSISEKAALLRRNGIKIGDAIIAATAWHYNATPVTHDQEFKNIKEITVIDPL